ncbi:hypothetical protein Bbelb_081560 [Branchiostoma belcheri]|nr:hypothetical protein Bbelb_081560 [Branchiostoma belcheri]
MPDPPSHNLIPDRSAMPPACPSAGAPSHLSIPATASCEVSRVSCTWVCTDSPQCGFVTRQPRTRAALRMCRLETENALDDAVQRVNNAEQTVNRKNMTPPAAVSQGHIHAPSPYFLSSVSSPVVSDPASDEEVMSSNPDCHSHGLHATEEGCSLQDGTSKCNVCRLLRVLQPPAPCGSSPPRNDPKPERVEPVNTENDQNTFPGNSEGTEYFPWQRRTKRLFITAAQQTSPMSFPSLISTTGSQFQSDRRWCPVGPLATPAMVIVKMSGLSLLVSSPGVTCNGKSPGTSPGWADHLPSGTDPRRADMIAAN